MDYIPLVVLLVVLIQLAVVNTMYKRKLRAQIEGFFRPRYIHQVMRNESTVLSAPMVLLFINGMLIFGLVTYLILVRWFGENINDWLLYLKLTGMFGALIFYFMIAPWLVSRYFQADAGLQEYRYSLLLFIQSSSILMLPVCLLAAYGADGRAIALWILIGATGAVFLYRLIRGFILGFQSRVSTLYIILYLCSLEILPLVVLGGVLSGKIY